MERASPHTGGTDTQLYGSGKDHWTAQGRAGRGQCVRIKSCCCGGAVPSGSAKERQPGWIPLGRKEESGPAGKGTFSKWQLGKRLPQRTRSTAKEEGILNCFSTLRPLRPLRLKLFCRIEHIQR